MGRGKSSRSSGKNNCGGKSWHHNHISGGRRCRGHLREVVKAKVELVPVDDGIIHMCVGVVVYVADDTWESQSY